MSEYELDKWCEQHCQEEDPNCMKCPVFVKYVRSNNN